MSAVHQTVDKFIQKFDHLGQTTKVSLFLSLIIFTAIPVTVMALYSWRTLSSSASTSTSVNLRPSGTVENNPVFSWACYCQPAKFTVYLREGDSNFLAGDWYNSVLHNNTTNNTPQYLSYNNGLNWAAVNYRLPGALKPNTRYYWTVAACDTTCINSSEIKSFTTPASNDTQAPTIPTNVTLLDTRYTRTKEVDIAWTPSTDNVGVVKH